MENLLRGTMSGQVAPSLLNGRRSQRFFRADADRLLFQQYQIMLRRSHELPWRRNMALPYHIRVSDGPKMQNKYHCLGQVRHNSIIHTSAKHC